jgi:glycerophosphoryl diester phosphodiesterase
MLSRATALTAAFLLSAGAAWAGTFACAHRGDQKNAPENTLPAIRSAVQKGAHMIEFDVQAAKGGALVVMHDDTVDRTTNGTGKVSDLTYAEIAALDAGSWFDPRFAGVRVPLMAEVLDTIPRAILCNVHIKGSPVIARVAAIVLQEMGRLGHCFLACTEEQAEAARAAVPGVMICNMSRQGGDRAAYVERTIAMKAEYIQLTHKQGIDGLKDDVARLHQHGVKVNFFGAQEEPLIRSLVDAEVDYILTDNLELCLRVLAEYGTQPLPRQQLQENAPPPLVTVQAPAIGARFQTAEH